MEDVCKCQCHTDSGIRHIAACCMTCPKCQQRIMRQAYEQHVQKCG